MGEKRGENGAGFLFNQVINIFVILAKVNTCECLQNLDSISLVIREGTEKPDVKAGATVYLMVS